MKRTALAVALYLTALGSLQAAEPKSPSASICPMAAVASVAPAPLFLSGSPQSACPAALETDYYTDATHSTKVGMCVITCQQWDLDPGAQGKCTGTITSFPGGGPLRLCPCPP